MAMHAAPTGITKTAVTQAEKTMSNVLLQKQKMVLPLLASYSVVAVVCCNGVESVVFARNAKMRRLQEAYACGLPAFDMASPFLGFSQVGKVRWARHRLRQLPHSRKLACCNTAHP